jgi:hypothetical protein
VHTNPSSYWGTAVDIAFADVDINGGRPRRSDGVYNDLPYCKSTDVCSAFRSAYISGNPVAGDIVPPTGGILEPLTGTVLKAKTISIEAWASDEGSGLDKAQLIAYYDGVWQEIGGEYAANVFTLNWDMCAAGVPNGPVSLSVQAWDKEGNPSFGLPGMVHFTKDYNCAPPPPACTLTADRIVLFSAPDYGGECLQLEAGEYPDSASFGVLGDDNAASIQVGSNVLATLYSDADYAGRGETLAASDANLADNWIGTDLMTSLRVRLRSNPPPKPTVLIAPQAGATFPAGASLSLAWRDPGGATAFQATLLSGGTTVKTSDWLAKPVWHLSGLSLGPGAYTWKVRARNCAETSCQSAWSAASSFVITAGAAPPAAVTAPFLDAVEGGANGWTPTGMWNRLNDSSKAHAGAFSWYYGNPVDGDYKDSTPNTGDLTSRPITIPGAGYALRFWYNYKTEGPGRYWDQRMVQISTNGGAFKNVRLLYDDVPDYWLKSEIDLSAYAGETIRVRFHFETLDGAFNAFEGWFIDDLEISTGLIPDCSDADNRASDASPIAYGQSLSQAICPSGDVDYYTFSGAAGDRVVVDIDSNPDNPPDGLDPILFLLDANGNSVLAQNDDEIPGEVFDPHLGYTLTRTGDYYLKVRLWAHPSFGGEDFSYTLKLIKDNGDPAVSFTQPTTGDFLANLVTLDLSASDGGSGISRVEFSMHTSDWLSGDWQALGTDTDGSDGWSYSFDASSLPEQQGLAFYASVYDWAGNWAGAGAWDLGLDRSAPVTALQPLAATQPSTAILAQWTGSDNLAGLDYYNLQSKKGSGAWTTLAPNPDGPANQAWFVGDAGSAYSFRMRGVDLAGNSESYPASAEASTTIPAATTLCSAPDARDSGGGDNSPATAKSVQVGAAPETHNFCNPLASNRLNDIDWVYFSVEKGKVYILQGVPLASSTAVILELYAVNGTTQLAQASAAGFGENVQIAWTSDRTGRVYLRARHLDGRVIGNAVTFQIVVREDYKLFLPVLNRSD